MIKEDFKLGNSKFFIDDYVYEDENYLLVINKDIFDDDTVEYANRIIEKYIQERDKILDYMLDLRLREWYNSNSDEDIKANIGKPQIRIDFKKDENHPDWKFQYAGIIDFCENNLDEHIISIEFKDELELDDDVQING